MDENRMYVCALCGKEYETVEERIACETKCLAEFKAAELQKKLEEEKENKLASNKAIEEELDKIDQMVKEHLRKYENLKLSRNYYYLSYLFKSSPFWF